MGFGQRKLMDESSTRSINITVSTQTINGTLSHVCEPFCDSLLNDSGYCISPCLDICPINCHYAIPPPIYPVFSPPPPPPAPPPPPPATKRHVSGVLIITSVALSFAVLVVLVYFICASCRRRRRVGRNVAQPQRAVPPQDDEFLGDIGPVLDHPIWYIHTVGLHPSVISKITVYKYKRGEGLIEGTDCSVCLTEFEEDETLRLLPKCSHAFHIACIDAWLQSHTNCPNCRAPIVTNTVQSPSPEPSNVNSWEEIRLDQGLDDVDLGGEIESAPLSRGETEEEAEQETEGLNANRLQDVVDQSKDEIQAVRRSVSLDSLSAAMINVAVADFLMGKSTRKPSSESGDEENQDHKSKRVFGDSSTSSIGRSVQFLSGSSSSTRRSLSLSGRFLASKYSWNRSSLLPL